MTLGWSVPARLVRWVSSAAITVAVCRALAGRWDLPWMWATAGVGSLGALVLMLAIDPDLARERRRPGPGGFDRFSRTAIAICVGAEGIFALLDVGRWHWSDHVPVAVHVASLTLFALGFGVVVWAIWVNRFFSSVVRIQTDRGHQLVTAGPYRYIRHPGYLGMLLAYPVIGLAIGSWWTLVPGAIGMAVVLRRMLVEDGHLQQHLPGYREYVSAVPGRLIPRVWR
ncbi:MAG TPA: isoprenylcysteine carboxylmethyltransferase family protein [Gemmatimonadales bacterium]|nr:isoprenylcysteine carboxylmethyltransferase family protein [Gemmatimonadales bacterium]